MEGRVIGPFLVDEKLGAGGMGAVYRAMHIDTGRSVALKVLSARVSTSRRAVARFAREIEILKTLKHPNIVRCFGGGRHETDAYLAMELVSGGSLAALLRRRGRLTWEAAVDYMVQICSGLAYAHEWGIIHRDLTPANLLLTAEGQVKIADFGIARVSYGKRLTATKHTLGTVAYMAPEQIRGKPAVSHQSDLYTLGCVMFEMLTGRLPFVAESTAEMLYQHLGEEAPRVSTLVLDCPIWLDALVAQMLEKNPAKRPRDASAVVLALNEIREKVAAGGGMAEHALAGGPTAIKMSKDKAGARAAMGRKKKAKVHKQLPFYERAWFLVACLAGVICLGAWALWPASEETLIAKAKVLMETEDRQKWQEARMRYLEPLLERFPKGEHAPQAQEYLDQIEMDVAEKRLKVRTQLGKPPKSEGESLYADAWRYEQFGDRVSALEKYESMVQFLTEPGKDRPYVNLAKRQIQRLTQGEQAPDSRMQFILSKLDEADRLHAEGYELKAQTTWRNVVTLYGENRELAKLVERAQSRLAEDDKSKSSRTETRDAGNEPADNASTDSTAADVEPAPGTQEGNAQADSGQADSGQANGTPDDHSTADGEQAFSSPDGSVPPNGETSEEDTLQDEPADDTTPE